MVSAVSAESCVFTEDSDPISESSGRLELTAEDSTGRKLKGKERRNGRRKRLLYSIKGSPSYSNYSGLYNRGKQQTQEENFPFGSTERARSLARQDRTKVSTPLTTMVPAGGGEGARKKRRKRRRRFGQNRNA